MGHLLTREWRRRVQGSPSNQVVEKESAWNTLLTREWSRNVHGTAFNQGAVKESAWYTFLLGSEVEEYMVRTSNQGVGW